MGLYDRNYMRDRQAGSNDGKQMLTTLIIINVAAFFIIRNSMFDEFALTINYGSHWNTAWLWQIFTAGFLHSGFSHILFNMWGLYIFGSLVAHHISGSRMLSLYLAGTACGNILFILCNLEPQFPMQLVGASGAVCAMMAAAATLEPERRFVMIFMPFSPIKTTTLVICYTVMEILFELSGDNSSIAHLAHLGGFAGGYMIMRFYFGSRLPWDPFRSLFRKISSAGAHPGFPPPPRKTTQQQPPRPDNRSENNSRVSQRELDALLDKLSNSGINSLSDYELSRLRKARKQMRGEE